MSKLGDIAEQSQTEPVTEKQNTKKEIDSLELESKKIEIEAKKLEVLVQQANLQDIQERLAERDLVREQKRQKSLGNGLILKQTAAAETAHQRKCNHRKGGNGMVGIVSGEGQDPQYAVLKHTFANGDTWVRCLRCGKTWKPPLEKWFKSEQEFLTAKSEYEAAVNFYTRNVTSVGAQFRFSDNGQYYREITANTTLR